jgi:predicted restriction endonuclease
MVLDKDMNAGELKAAHIWPHKTGGRDLDQFGLTPADVHKARNGLLLCNAIEEAFDRKRVCFQYNGLDKTFRFWVLDPALLDETVGDKEWATTFRDLHERQLLFPEDRPPFRRLLYWHAHCSMRWAKRNKWSTEGSEVLVDLQMLSPGARLPAILRQLRQDDSVTDDRSSG